MAMTGPPVRTLCACSRASSQAASASARGDGAHCSVVTRFHPDELAGGGGGQGGLVVAQLGGDDLRQMAKAASRCEEAGYSEVNINMGCPARSAKAGRHGAALMQPDAHDDAVRLTSALVDQLSVPVPRQSMIALPLRPTVVRDGAAHPWAHRSAGTPPCRHHAMHTPHPAQLARRARPRRQSDSGRWRTARSQSSCGSGWTPTMTTASSAILCSGAARVTNSGHHTTFTTC